MFNYVNKIRLLFLGIFILVLAAAVLDFPEVLTRQGINISTKPFHLGLDLQGGTHLIYRADLSKVEPGEEGPAVAGVRDVIERRVNAFGVAEPLVQTAQVNNDWRVIVELAGVTDVNQAIQMIGETPLLEFKEQNPNPEVNLTEEQQQEVNQINAEAKTTAETVLAKALEPNADFIQLAQEYSKDQGTAANGGDLGFASRGDFVPEFEATCLDQLKPGETATTLTESGFGYHIIKKEEERGDGDSYQAHCRHILIPIVSQQALAQAIANDQWLNTALTGTHLKRARVEFEQTAQAPQVTLEFDGEGADLFAAITERNVGKPVAIFLDGQPISTPTVQSVITAGRAVITGQFSIEEAKLLAQRLNAGALPVPIELISQQTIGSALGELSLQKSLTAGIIGLIIVGLFMIIYYRLPGLVAVVTLISYGILVLAVFKLIPVTLSLAGIAGFILSLGMAVDANVLIFERIKEELKSDRNLPIAIKEGFKRAWPSILDGNISTLITCLILIGFTTSLVKGFAVTLSIGILISMFSAMIITRVILQLLVRYQIVNKYWLFGVSKGQTEK